MENAPFGSVGGLGCRKSMKVPAWVQPLEEDEYLQAYRDAAREQYGDDWETCEFGWSPALTIESDPE
jgi:hypothetical protein